MGEVSPARVDRAALERIIRRAAELQTAEREIGETISSDELISLGKEVGIPVRYLQQALLEERTRTGEGSPGLLDQVVGPSEVTAERVVSLEAEAVERALIGWMEENELLCIQRHRPGNITWEPLSGFQAAVRRSTAAFGGGKRPYMLSRAATVTAAILPLESGYSHIALGADGRKIRGEYAGTGAALATMGAAGSGIMVALGALLPVALLPLPFAVAAGYVVIRRYSPALDRLKLGLERALDSLENGVTGVPPQLPGRSGLMGLLADEVRKALKS
jgi:hypothetical protein